MTPPTTNPTDYRGRFLYLETLEKHWPEMLTSLAAVLPEWREGRATPSTDPAASSFQELRSRPQQTDRTEALQAWAKACGVGDEWLMDAAVQTLTAWSEGVTEQRWFYLAPETLLLAFQGGLHGVWLPPMQSWPEFKRAMAQQLTEQLEQYRKTVEKHWGEDRRSSGEHALWTVWWQQGNSPNQILKKSLQSGHPRVTLANIQVRVQGFARSIGLTLRGRKTTRARAT